MNSKENELVVIRRHNNVVDAPEKGTMSLFERQILLYLQGVGYGTNKREFEIDINEFKLPGKRLTTGQKTSLDKACERLNAAQIREPLLSEDGTLKYFDPKTAPISAVKKIKYIPVFSEITLDFETNTIKAIFNDRFLPYLSRMDSHYTSYLFKDIKILRKANSARLYELIERGIGKYNSREFLVSDFLDLLGYPEKSTYRKSFREVNRRILEPCCKELTEKTRVNVTWEVSGKKGNTTTKIKILWQLKSEVQALEQNEAEDIKDVEVISSTVSDVDNTDDYKDELSDLINQGLLSQEVIDQINKAKELAKQKSAPVQASLDFSAPKKITKVHQEKIEKLRVRLKEIGLPKSVIELAVKKYTENINWKIWPQVNHVKMAMRDGEKFPNKHTLKKWIEEAID